MKKKISFSVLGTVCIGILLCMYLYNTAFLNKAAFRQTSPGLYEMDQSENLFYTDCYLAGQWEYYPNQLIFSQNSSGNLPGILNSMNPILIYDSAYYNKNTPYENEEFALKHTSTQPNTDADYITIPSSYSAPFQADPPHARASYRFIIRGLRTYKDAKFTLSLNGLVDGNTKVYINGREGRTMVSPWGYPVFILRGPNVEIVIETTNTAQFLNICPRLTFQGIAMTFFDTAKNVLMILASMLTAALLILVLTNFSLEPKRFRAYFFLGLLYTFFFIVSSCWVFGYLDTITKYVPQSLLSCFSRILLLLGTLYGFSILKKHHPGYYSKRQYRISQCSLLLLAVLQIFRGFSTSRIVPAAGFFLLLFLLLWWFVRTCRIIDRTSLELTLFLFGFLALQTGSFSVWLYNRYGIANGFIYLLPVCLIAYALLMIAASKLYQKQLFKHTQELLELEKTTSKMQTAMLASQIKPHFLYNTLTTIQEMCYTEPEQAADLIVYFSRYLRNNIDFMDYTDLIPFTRELEHIENYIYIENARFKDALKFEKHINVQDFSIPPLSIQPLIENAVKYGIRKNADTGTIYLETEKTQLDICIRVTNSGPGFDPTQIKERHSLENIKTRISSLLHGNLKIDSSPASSQTVMEIHIPLQDNFSIRKGETR